MVNGLMWSYQQGVWAADRGFLVQDTVNFPVHLKNFNLSQLRQLCKELRSDIVHTVSKTGGTCASANYQSFPALSSFCKDLHYQHVYYQVV